MPRVYLIPSDQPNAFATGRDPDHAAAAVTQGMLRSLSPDELRGVIGHELAHVKHRDILIGTVAATIAGAISMLANMAQWAFIFGGGRGGNDREGGNPIGAIALMIFAPLAAMLRTPTAPTLICATIRNFPSGVTLIPSMLVPSANGVPGTTDNEPFAATLKAVMLPDPSLAA